MGVLFFEGFETVGTETGSVNATTTRPRVLQRWDKFQGPSPNDGGAGFLIPDANSEGYAWGAPGQTSFDHTMTFAHYWSPEIRDVIAVPHDTLGQNPKFHIIGFRLHIPITARDVDIFSVIGLTGSSTFQNTGPVLRIIGSTDLQIFDNPHVLAEADGVFTPGQWHYIEYEFRLGDTSGSNATDGSVRVNVDGIEVIPLTAVDTDSELITGPASRDYAGFQFSWNGGSSTTDDFWALDDIYALFMEGESAPYDDFLGPVRVISYPLDGDASPIEWTPSTPGDHYSLINENGADDAGYVESDTDGQTDKFTISDFTGQGTIYALKIEAEAINTVGGTPSLTISDGVGDDTEVTVDDTDDYTVFSHITDLAGFDDVEASITFNSGF